MARPPLKPEIRERVLELHREGYSPPAVVQLMGGAVSQGSAYNIIRAAEKAAKAKGEEPPNRPSRAPGAAANPVGGIAPPHEPAATADERDRKLDQMIPKTLTWQRIQAAIAGALARHPEAARDVARALRGVRL